MTYPQNPGRSEARKLLAAGPDPAVRRKLGKLAAANAARSTFGAVAEEYIANAEASGAAERTVIKYRWLLQDLAASLGHRRVEDGLGICGALSS